MDLRLICNIYIYGKKVFLDISDQGNNISFKTKCLGCLVKANVISLASI